IDRHEVAVGETATITVRATSEGSLASASIAPPAHLDGLRVRAGETRAVHDASSGRVVTTLTAEILLVPERAGTFRPGAVELPYWDPVAERYQIARAELPALAATGHALPREAGDHDGTGGAGPGALLRPLTRDPALRGVRPWFAPGRATLALIALLPLALA